MGRFALFSADGAGLPVAYRLKQDGHSVVAWIHEPKATHLYRGLLKHVDTWQDALAGDPICLFDSVGIGTPEDDRPDTNAKWEAYDPLSEQITRKGYRVIGSNKFADRLEWDRPWAAQLAKKAGLTLPLTEQFDDMDEAIDFVQSTGKRFVLKPCNNQATFSVFLAQGPDDMIAKLEKIQVDDQFGGGTVELQEFISGMQLSIEGWWTGDRFVGLNSTKEHKPVYDKDLGPLSGEAGSVVFYYPPGEATKMQQEVLDKLVPLLEEHHYPPGPLDVNTIVNEDGFHFLEFTSRLGYPAAYIQLFSTESNWGQALEDLSDGTFSGFSVKPFHWFIGSRVWLPWWPSGKTDKQYAHFPYFSRLTSKELDHVSLVDAYFKDDRLLSGGTDGELMTVTAAGESIQEARGRLYDLLNRLYLYPMAWRTDLGVELLDKLADLKRWGLWIPALQ